MKKSKMFVFGLLVVMLALALIGCDFLSGENTNGDNTNGNSGGSTNPTITIKNNTGYNIFGVFIKPSTSTNWGSDLWGNMFSSLRNGESHTFTLSQSLSANNVYDILLSEKYYSALGEIPNGGGANFIKYNLTCQKVL